MCGNVSGVTDLQEMVSGSVQSRSSYLLVCLVCCLVWIIITYKESFHILLYQKLEKFYGLIWQVQLIVPVGLHHQRNVCCKTWHKKPGTEVCIGCHALYWQFYQQWTDEFWCVAPACCLHTVVPGIVCDGRDIAVKCRLFHIASCLSSYYSPFNPICTPFDRIYRTVLPHHISRYDTCHCHVGHRYVMWECGSISVEQ